MGQSHARRLTRPELDRALEYYEAALKIDPNFALAHHGVARVWGARVQIGLATRAEEGGRADAAMTKAMALDDSLPEGHMVLGNRATWVEWDWPAAESSFGARSISIPVLPRPTCSIRTISTSCAARGRRGRDTTGAGVGSIERSGPAVLRHDAPVRATIRRWGGARATGAAIHAELAECLGGALGKSLPARNVSMSPSPPPEVALAPAAIPTSPTR